MSLKTAIEHMAEMTGDAYDAAAERIGKVDPEDPETVLLAQHAMTVMGSLNQLTATMTGMVYGMNQTIAQNIK